jgi:GPH family glycoside/pentoside/hexuronide:cation symporter
MASEHAGGIEKFKGWRLQVYNISAGGWTLIESILMTYYVGFFLPPKERVAEGMVQFITDENIFMGLTVLGMIMMFGRILDAIFDPLVATWSDSNRSSFGRRRLFLAIGGLPLALSVVLVFFPPIQGISHLNAIYLALMFGLFFISFTFYVAPYLALIPELGHTEAERLSMTTWQGIWTLVGSAIVLMGGPQLIKILKNNMDILSAYRWAIIIMVIPGLLFCYAAILAVDEKRFSNAKPSNIPFFESFLRTLKNKQFLIYLFSNMTLWFYFNILRSTSLSMALVLGKADEGFAANMFFYVIGGSALCFLLISPLAKKFGKKPLMLLGLGMFFLTGLGFAATPIVPIPPKIWLRLVAILAAMPTAVLIIVPKVILSEICSDDAHKTGQRREAMFFGVQGFFQKMNLGVSGVVVAGMYSVFGKDIASPMGVQLTPLVGAAITAIGFFVMMFYKETHTVE